MRWAYTIVAKWQHYFIHWAVPAFIHQAPMHVFKTVPECGEEYKGQKRLNSEPNISERSGTDACQSLPLAAGLEPINPSTDGPRGWVRADEWTRFSTIQSTSFFYQTALSLTCIGTNVRFKFIKASWICILICNYSQLYGLYAATVQHYLSMIWLVLLCDRIWFRSC